MTYEIALQKAQDLEGILQTEKGRKSSYTPVRSDAENIYRTESANKLVGHEVLEDQIYISNPEDIANIADPRKRKQAYEVGRVLQDRETRRELTNAMVEDSAYTIQETVVTGQDEETGEDITETRDVINPAFSKVAYAIGSNQRMLEFADDSSRNILTGAIKYSILQQMVEDNNFSNASREFMGEIEQSAKMAAAYDKAISEGRTEEEAEALMSIAPNLHDTPAQRYLRAGAAAAYEEEQGIMRNRFGDDFRPKIAQASSNVIKNLVTSGDPELETSAQSLFYEALTGRGFGARKYGSA